MIDFLITQASYCLGLLAAPTTISLELMQTNITKSGTNILVMPINS